MRGVLKKIVTPFFQAFVKRYFANPRRWRYKTVRIVVFPGVFFPHFTLSTTILLQFLEARELTGKTLLELGCGMGAISVLAAQKGAIVTASDINPKAVDNAHDSAIRNGVEFSTVVSDLFEQIPVRVFDYIIINPPYYPRNPQNHAEEAWYCGEQFEYFEKLFSGIGRYVNSASFAYMILSEDCEIQRIKAIAKDHRIEMKPVLEKKKWGEKNFIFQLVT